MKIITKSIAGLSVCLGILLGVVTTVGHFHRYSFEQQTEQWHDGVEEYVYVDNPTDTFEENYYQETTSVDSAIEFIRKTYNPKTALEEMNAVYDFTRKRFKHFMYPHHTFLTNPYMSLGELLIPSKPVNGIYVADVALRHSAVGACGTTSATFVEIYREMGGMAQFGRFIGHDLAEAEVDGKRYIIDADLETIIPHSLKEISDRPELAIPYYEHLPKDRVDQYISVFGTDLREAGYESVPATRADVYITMQIVEYIKWVIPVAMVLLGVFLWRKSSRQSNSTLAS